MGYAYLPDGTRIDYEEYLQTGWWRQKKQNRLAFDNWQCGICHRLIEGNHYDTHHLDYTRLGHEDMEHDLITLCSDCHKRFHEIWKKSDFWITSGGSPLQHWRDYSLPDTAKLCRKYRSDDYWFGGEYNLCNQQTVQNFIDRYFVDNGIRAPAVISEQDVVLLFRNLRYRVILQNAQNKIDMEAWLDTTFGPRGQKGGNPRRAEARAFYTKHKIGAIKRIIKENSNIVILQDEMNKEETDHE